MKELKEAFDGEGKSNSKKERLLLTAAVPASFEAISAGYDVPEINKYLDFMNVMTYDFHGDWEQVVGHNSPLFPLNAASLYHKKLTVVSLCKFGYNPLSCLSFYVLLEKFSPFREFSPNLCLIFPIFANFSN